MNYYQPRELKDKDGNPSGIWHYTCMNDGRIWPVGYCAQGCPGHDTKEGAYEHYRQYELDTSRYDGTYSGTQRKCEICGEWTQRFASVGPDHMEMHTLCDAHRNRETLDTLVEAGDSFGSW